MGPPRKRTSSRISKGVLEAQKKQRINDLSEAPRQIAATGEYIEDNDLYTVKCKTESNREACGITGELRGDPSSADRINGEPSEPSFKDFGVNCLSLEKLYKIKDEQEEGHSYSPSIDANASEPPQDQKWMLKEENNIFTPETEEKKAKSFTCFCGKSYTCTSHLNRHRKIHASEVQPSSASHHKARVSEVKPAPRGFACVCGKQYTRRSNLKRHQFGCTEQVRGTTKERVVAQSKVEDQEEKLKPYVCACGKSYTCSSHLYRHQRTHAEFKSQNEKRFICVCGKTYSCSSHLYRHQRTHTEAKDLLERRAVVEDPEDVEKRLKPHLCFCGKRYTCTSHLYRHQKAQHPENIVPRETPKVKVEEPEPEPEPEPEKRYKCDCGKSYTSSSHLYRHQRSHQEQNFTAEANDFDHDTEVDFEECRQKPYKCECGKSFILSFSLLLHKKIHCRWKHTTD